MARPFRIVNVFTVDGDPFSGNPLCVVEDARGLSTEQMQAIARQMNLSETTFVLPAQAGGVAHVRIFTPGFEMPFAGHPTLGTAFVIANGRTAVTLEMKAGHVPVTIGGSLLTLRAARAPTTRPMDATRAEVAAMLGLPLGALPDDPTLAPLWVNTGVEQLVIPLTSVEHVRATKPVLALIEKHGFSAARDEAMAYVWARGEREWEVRFFFTSNGALLEDPATGSACANLGGYLLARAATLPLSAMLLQGAAISRPSRLGLIVDAEPAIYVSGTAMEVGRGTLAI
ncbi:MAG TPA: PhzF family phenazine biosynthesis protein [Kofleriaceae bacterium]|jgi:PhzF family phenazine biosynthesis protein